jgi:hypothetical protein
MQSTILVFALVFLVKLNACARAPTQEKRMVSDAQTVSLSGRVNVIDPMAVVHDDLKVQLWRGKELLAETKAEKGGRFTLAGTFPFGDYTLRVTSKKYAGESTITVQSQRLDDITLTAERKPKG